MRSLVAILGACAALVVLAGGAAGADGPKGSTTAPGTSPVPYTFFPLAGLLWQDLYIANFVDLDPADGAVKDFACGGQTYDTHTGEDTIIRSFREQAIGVPVFAALDGVVLSTQDGQKDTNTAVSALPWDNHVIVDDGNGQRTVYGHLRKGTITVKPGQRVRAGRQLGLAGSSGNSSWPHLHLTTIFDDQVIEPFAGPCRPGASNWVSQPPFPLEQYVRGFTFGTRAFRGLDDVPWDRAPRTGTYVRGVRDVWFRVEVGNGSGSPLHVTFLRPDGSVALDDATGASLPGGRLGARSLHYRPDLDVTGTWRLRLETGGATLLEAPFTVVPRKAAVRNRAPLTVTASLARTTNDVVLATVATSLVRRDPDYDIVSYRYRWTVGGRVVRQVTTAALSDAIPAGTVSPGQTVACAVTPTDGRLRARTTTATLAVPA
jgi:hypothetical protein